MGNKGSSKSKVIPFILGLGLLSLITLYVLDEYVFTKNTGIYFTKGPSLRERIFKKSAEEMENVEVEKESEPVKEKKEEIKVLDSPEPEVPKIKSVKDMMRMLSVSYPEWAVNDWEYNIKNSKVKKIKKSIYGKEELREWDLEMHGEANTLRLSKGVEEFYKKKKEVGKVEEKAEPSSETSEISDENGEETLTENEGETIPVAQPTAKEKEKEQKPARERIDIYSYRVKRFMPGHAANGYFLDYGEVGFETAGAGAPDFTMTDQTDFIKLADHKAQFLALGNGGSIVYEITGGELIDGDGPDFVVYADSAFSKKIKTAKVEVAFEDSPGAYSDFPCNSVTQPYDLCAGVHPVYADKEDPILKRGDAYDLARIGMKRVRFIKITDTGDNYSDVPLTDGFNLDSIALIHAYKPENTE